VLRARLARGADAASVTRFADAAYFELEALSERLDALLVLARPPREPIDLHAMLKRFAALYGAAAASEGGSLSLWPAPDLPLVTIADPDAVRLVLAAAVDMATLPAGEAECGVRLDEQSGDIAVTIRRTGSSGDARPAGENSLRLGASVKDAALEAGIRVLDGLDGVTIIFPRAHSGREESRT
jgi:hypothetical protein